MRPSRAEQQTDLQTTLPTKRRKLISGVCSECGTIYQVEANGGDENWSCPRCGPSLPIDVNSSPIEPARRVRSRARRPKIRLPFFAVQMLIVCLTFVLFMGGLIRYMDQGGAHRTQLADETSSANPIGDNAMADAGTSTGADSTTADTPNTPLADASSAQKVAPLTTDAKSDDTAGQLASNNQMESSRPADSKRPDSDTAAPTTVAVPIPTEFASLQESLQVSVLPNAMTARDVVERMLHSFGRELTIQCRLVAILDDAAGKVPHRFNISGQKYDLRDEDDERFVRLEVVDIRGEPLDAMFAPKESTLQHELKWLMPGDWMIVSATPGVRYGNSKRETGWGLILTKIAALQEHTHQSEGGVPRKLAER